MHIFVTDCISGTTWATKNSFSTSICILVWRAFRLKDSFWNPVKNQLIFAKALFCQKKESYWKKSAILKNSKLFFNDLRFRNWTYVQSSFRLKIIMQPRQVSRIFVNLIFISSHHNNDQMNKLFLSNRCPIERLYKYILTRKGIWFVHHCCNSW